MIPYVHVHVHVIGPVTCCTVQYSTEVNECTKVQNPRYKDVTLNAYTSA